jgi:predicted nucleic acid-binding protein
MAENTRIIVDTDIIIKIYRGDEEKRELLRPIQSELGISVITAMELMIGAKSRKREFEVSKTIKAYSLFPLTNSIGTKAFSIIKKYHLDYSILVADALIAATAIHNSLPLYTDNINDYVLLRNCNYLGQNDVEKRKMIYE